MKPPSRSIGAGPLFQLPSSNKSGPYSKQSTTSNWPSWAARQFGLGASNELKHFVQRHEILFLRDFIGSCAQLIGYSRYYLDLT
ncbi:hypothetical protein CDV31_015973 [Fusarium ambrosium]|uniref:Uncharacterized protein n=1 Tax=Fusarium ambrosium TaxID=131363 RepID=A0A428SGH3_9HYPO|nr:hypothetical protein CDV31_015973 [Fusarium ambrosium]